VGFDISFFFSFSWLNNVLFLALIIWLLRLARGVSWVIALYTVKSILGFENLHIPYYFLIDLIVSP